MIFKRWFKPKWQHENPAVRQLAIAELDQQTPTQKEILHELAFNDGTEAVRRAALERLNEFSLWWQASKHEPAERLKQFAEQQLVHMLLENRVSPALKAQFIEECQRSSILEKLALQESDAAVKLQLLHRLNRQELYLAALQDKVLPESSKLTLLTLIDDDKQLEKAGRQCSEPLQQAIQAELQQRHEQRQKPEKLRKQLVLLLARLNAVREKTDVTQAEQQWRELSSQWQALQDQLPVLPEEERAEFSQKYQRISEQTTNMLAPKLAALAAAAQAEQQKVARQQQQQHALQQLQLLQQQLGQQIADGALDQAAVQQQAFETLRAQIEALQLPAELQSPLQAKIKTIQQQFDQLPQLAEALAQAARLLAELSAQPLPEAADAPSAFAGFRQWQKQWQQASKAAGAMLPEAFVHSYQALVKQWQEHCEPLLESQQKQSRLLRSKLSEFKRLHQEGRYKILFGLWKGIQTDVAQLSPAQRQLLEKDLQLAEQAIADLADLQAYIATPRKQALIATLQQLLEDNSLPVAERARQVKQARQHWNSLGRAEPELEEQLNEQFNQLSELAFAPCREFYAAQDLLRQQAAANRQQVIAELQQLSESGLQGKALDQALQSVQQRWQQAGAVSKEQYDALQSAYQAALQPLKKLQQQAYDDAATVKRNLIGQARQFAETALGEQVEQMKQLQQQWKLTGFAGPKQDQALWTEFRTACDAFFAKRQQQREAELQQLQQRRHDVTAELAQVAAAEGGHLSESQLQQALEQLEAIDTADDKALRQQQQQLRQQLRQQLQQRQQQAEQGQFRQLFAALENSQVQAAELPPVYRLVFNQRQESLSRADLTLALEWAAGVVSPEAESARRQQVQMQLLSDKHNSGDNISQNQLLGRWLQHGPVQPEEQPLLARVRALYLG